MCEGVEGRGHVGGEGRGGDRGKEGQSVVIVNWCDRKCVFCKSSFLRCGDYIFHDEYFLTASLCVCLYVCLSLSLSDIYREG